MNEVLRLKKLEEKKEIDKQVSQGILTYGSPDIKKHKETEMSAQNDLSDAVARAIS
jgi:ABC-type Fe3+/spermidine/putrescine transport system ATPase subunit